MSNSQTVILNVDDNEAARRAKTRALGLAGEVEIVEAATGAEAFRLVRELRPTLMLLDVGLPDVSGHEVCRIVKRDHPEVLVLETSASPVGGSDRARGLDAGADSFLEQPCEPDELVASVRALLRIRRAEAALRESEANFRTLADNMPMLCWMADAAGSVYWFNRRWYEYTGTTSEQTLGWGWGVVHDAAVLPTVLERWKNSIANVIPFEMVFPLRGSDGVFRPFLTRVAPVSDETGRILRWFGTNTDISVQRAAEERLRELNETLEQRVSAELAQRLEAESAVRQLQKMDAIGRLAGGIAHDFNNMMAVVISSLNLMERQLAKGGTDLSRYIEAAVDGATRASSLTRRLLAFSRQQPLAPELIDVNPMVASMMDLLARTLGEQIHLETDLSPNVLQIKVDVSELENALLNLAVNARDAMPNGGRLTIKTTPATINEPVAQHFGIAPGEYVIITVSDTGSGMEPDIVEKVFDPFFTTKGVGKGTGLGLSQVFGFVRQSGGHVKISSRPGLGAAVSIYMPRSHGEPSGEKSIAASERGGSREEVILVVEDEERVRTLSLEALRELGYSVIGVSSAREALRLVDSGQKVTLLFTDVIMPDMDGVQLAEFSREKIPDLKVLFTTGYAAKAFGKDETYRTQPNFIPKPFNVAGLAAKVREVLDADGPAGAPEQ
jgi:PAS domain S-box-containing protein